MTEKTYTEKFNLTGKTAIVTGGAGILGRRFCCGLAEFGANVVVADLHFDAASELAGHLKNTYATRTLALSCDVADQKSVQKMVAHVVSEFGEINILHNNAAGKSEDLNAFLRPLKSIA